MSPDATVFDAFNGSHSVRCDPPDAAEKIAKWVTVPAPDAAADVSTFAFAFTDGFAVVAACHPVAPTGVRAKMVVSVDPFVDHPT